MRKRFKKKKKKKSPQQRKNVEENVCTAMGEKKKMACDRAGKKPASTSETSHNDEWEEVKTPNAVTIPSSALDRCLMYCISL